MKASDRLLNLEGHELRVKKIGFMVCVCFENCEIKDEGVLIASFGEGETFEQACEDYLQKISGKTIVFNACTTRRKEVIVL